jgi:hypothetical protein
MPSVASPYGLKPVNELGGLPYAGSTRSIPINPAGLASNIFFGQVVAINSAGYITLVTTVGDTGTPFPAGTIGVFVGCQYVNVQGQTIFAQYYPAGTTGPILAYVIDDDRCVFQVQANGPMTQAKLGENVFFSAAQSSTTGSTVTGNSRSSVSTVSQTGAAAFRVVAFVDMVGFSVIGDAFTDILVKFNPGQHSYSNATGI